MKRFAEKGAKIKSADDLDCCVMMCLAMVVLLATMHLAWGSHAPFAMPEIALPRISDQAFPITSFGAKDEGYSCTEAIARAIAACEIAGGGRVVIPAGVWRTGKIHLRSNCELHLDKGAVLEFSDNPTDYLPAVPTSWEGVECLNYSPLIYAYDVENVSVTGPGEIRARMNFWRTWFDRTPSHMRATEILYHWCSTNAPLAVRDLTAIQGSNVRPHFIQFNRAKNVRLEGFSVRESPFWMIHLYQSENCVLRGIRSYCHGHNNDGVDVEMTKNVLIEDCDFDQGDDGIVLKSGRNQDGWRFARPTENVVIRRCNLHMSHSLLGIGSELSGGVRNVWMHDCRVECTGSMLKIKTNRRRGGFVENVWMTDVVCSDNLSGSVFAIDTNAIFQWARFPDYKQCFTCISNINVRNVVAGTCESIVNLKGDPHLPPRDLTVDGVRVRFARKGNRFVENCENVAIRNLSITHPEEAELEAKRIAVVIPLKNPAKGAAFFTQLENALPEVKRRLKLDLFPWDDGCVHTTLFPGRYQVCWPGKDGVSHVKTFNVLTNGVLVWQR